MVTDDCFIVVIARDRLPLLQKCINSILASNIGGAFFLAIDNGSIDGSAEYLKSIERINQVIVNPRNTPQWQKSFAIKQAHELFIKMGNKQYFAWIDDDMVLSPNWLQKGKKILEARPDVVAAAMHNDSLQERKHPTKKVVKIEGMNVRLKRHSNGPIWVVRKSFFDVMGLPPVTGRTDGNSMSDRFYDKRMAKMPGKFIAVLDNMATHLGYKESLRAMLQGKVKRRK